MNEVRWLFVCSSDVCEMNANKRREAELRLAATESYTSNGEKYMQKRSNSRFLYKWCKVKTGCGHSLILKVTAKKYKL